MVELDGKPWSAPAEGFVFEPRALATQTTAFGTTSIPLTPRMDVDANGPRWRAVQLQHLVANAVRESLAAEGSNLRKWVSDNGSSMGAGLSYDRLVRIQRGKTMMQLADLLHWASIYPAVDTALSNFRFAGDRPCTDGDVAGGQ